MKSRSVLMFVLIVLSMVQTSIAHAQQKSAPLVFNSKGDLWSLDGPNGKPKNLTSFGFNDNPILSPDGKQVAYASKARIFVDVWKKTGGFSGNDFPTNIWVLEVATGDAFRVADQPPDANFNGPNISSKPDNFIERSDPVWSPDGTSLAWGEYVYTGLPGQQPTQELYRVAIYNFAKKTTQYSDYKFPLQCCIHSVMSVLWGKSGIVALSSSRDQENVLFFLNSNGKLTNQAPSGDPGMPVRWVIDQDKEYLAVESTDKGWTLVDPATMETSELQGDLELYGLTAPDGLSLAWTTATDGKSSTVTFIVGGNPAGTIDATKILSDNVLADEAVISPDGKQAAYVNADGAIVFWMNGKATTVSGPDRVNGLAWGPVGWRVRHAT